MRLSCNWFHVTRAMRQKNNIFERYVAWKICKFNKRIKKECKKKGKLKYHGIQESIGKIAQDSFCLTKYFRMIIKNWIFHKNIAKCKNRIVSTRANIWNLSHEKSGINPSASLNGARLWSKYAMKKRHYGAHQHQQDGITGCEPVGTVPIVLLLSVPAVGVVVGEPQNCPDEAHYERGSCKHRMIWKSRWRATDKTVRQ